MFHSRLLLVLWLVMVCAAFACLNSGPAFGQASAKNESQQPEAVRLLEARDYAGLERLVGEIRKKVRPGDADARVALDRLYKDLAEPAIKDPATADEALRIRFEHLSDWIKTKPSAAGHIALADNRMDHAYRMRGTKFADATPEENLEAAHQAALESDRLLGIADGLLKKEGAVDPQLFSVWLRTGTLARFESDRMRELVIHALDFDPWNFDPVATYASYLRPRWFGQEGDQLAMAEELSRKYAMQTGDALYAYVAICAYTQGEIVDFPDGSFQWPRVRQGLKDWLKHVPNSEFLLAYLAKFGHVVNDRTTAREAVEQLGNRYNTSVFPEPVDYLRTNKWARHAGEKDGDGVVVEFGLSPAMDLAFLEGGESVAIAIRGTSLPVYSVADGSFRRWIELNVAGCERLASDPQGVVLYLASPRRTRTDVARLDIETGEKKALWPLKGRVLDFAAPPLPDRLFASNNAGALQNWEVEKSSGSAWSSGLNSDLRVLAVAPDARRLVAAGGNKVVVWDLEAKKISRTFEVDFASIHSVTWSPTNPDAVAVAGSGSTASIWSVTEGKVVSTFRGGTDDIADLAFSPDGTRLVAGTMSLDDIGLDANVLVWDVGTGQLVRTLSGNRLRVRSVAVSPDGTKVLSAGDDGTLRIWPMP